MSTQYKEYGYASADAGWAHHYLMSPLRKLLGPPRSPILDIGCGNGAVARTLLVEGYDVWGVDASESGIRLANEASPGRFFVLDAALESLPAELSDIQFEVVISTEVIEHIYDPRAFLAFARSILPEGGELIVSTPYHGYAKNLALAISGRMDDHFTVLWDGGHIKFFSRKTLEAMLLEQGFSDIEFLGAGRFPFRWKSMLLKSRVFLSSASDKQSQLAVR